MALQKSDGMDANESAEKGHAKKMEGKKEEPGKMGRLLVFFGGELYVWQKTTKGKNFLFFILFRFISARFYCPKNMFKALMLLYAGVRTTEKAVLSALI